jgi:secreted Zn-dependent insulinase-like peptidase
MSLFACQVQLTEAGLAAVDQVMQAIFEYLGMSLIVNSIRQVIISPVCVVSCF